MHSLKHLSMRSFALALMLMAQASTACLAGGVGNTVQGNLEIRQRHKILGPVKIVVGPKSFCMQLKSSHLTIESFAPDWNVFILQNRRHVYRRAPLESFDAPFVTNVQHLIYPLYGPSALVGKQSLFQSDTLRGKTYELKGNGVPAQLNEITSFKMPAAVSRIISKVYNLPIMPGLPWSLILYNNQNQRTEAIFETVDYRETSQAAKPSILANYRPCKSDVDLMANPSNAEEFGEFLK